MRIVRAVVTLGRKLREEHKLKVRQPLAALTVVHRDAAVREAVLASAALIADEINVKRVAVEADESGFASVTVKPNFKTLGKRCGSKLKAIGAALAGFGPGEVARLEAGEALVVEGETLTLADVVLQRDSKGDAAVVTDGDITVALDTRLDEGLLAEGIAREFVSLLQNARKDAGLEVADRITLAWSCSDPKVSAAIREHGAAIAKEVLAVDLREGSGDKSAELNKVPVQFALTKA